MRQFSQNQFVFPILALLLFLGINCNTIPEDGQVTKSVNMVSDIPRVKVKPLDKSDFSIEILSNGKLEAVQKAVLQFENEGSIERIMVKDGDLVKKGQVIAFQKSNGSRFEELKNDEILAKAKLNMEDILLGFGYQLKDSLNIPEEILNMARSRSGISEAKNQIAQTNIKRSSMSLKAPFSGVIVHTLAKEKTLSSLQENICTLVDNSKLYANFFILENEYGLVSNGDKVEVNPVAFPGQSFAGTVTSINPIVNENGLILVKAELENSDNRLVDGMSFDIVIKKVIPDTFGIPKTALVDRQNKTVVFSLKNGKSVWNYVKIGYRSRDSVTIIDGLKKGDDIIIQGGTYLSHDTEVFIIE